MFRNSSSNHFEKWDQDGGPLARTFPSMFVKKGSMKLWRSPSPPPEQGLVTLVHDRTMQGRWILAIACSHMWPPSPPPMVGLVTLVHGHSASFASPPRGSATPVHG